MHKTHNPSTVASPLSAYCHAVETTGAKRWLHVSGQVGVNADGEVAGDTRAQMQACWRNIFEILASAGMGAEHIVKVTCLLTDSADIALYRETRDAALGGRETASTMYVVAGLANPQLKVEIEVVAAD